MTLIFNGHCNTATIAWNLEQHHKALARNQALSAAYTVAGIAGAALLALYL